MVLRTWEVQRFAAAQCGAVKGCIHAAAAADDDADDECSVVL